MNSRNGLTTAAVLLAVCLTSPAPAQYDQAAWTDFTYAYTFDDEVGSYDLDGNTLPDLSFGGGAPSAGVLTIDNTLLQSAGATGVWETNIAADAYSTGYTFEFSAKVISETGTAGSMESFISPAVDMPTTLFGIGSSSTFWSSSATVIDSGDNTDDFHTFRVAQMPGEDSFFVWRDGQLIGYELGQGYSYANPRLWMGCGSGRGQGVTELDYMAVTSGFYLPEGYEFPTPDPIENMAEQASDAFTYRYEMDKDPTNVADIDLDSNGVADFQLYQVVPEGGTPGTAELSGNGTYVIDAPEEGVQCYIQSSQAGEVWADAGFTAGEGYTVEFSIKINSQLDETSTPFGIGTSASDASDIGIVTMTTDVTNYYNGGILDESDNSDDFHTIRIVRDAFEYGANYYVWRDGVLMTPDGIGASANGSINSIYLGDLGGASGGNIELDYLRFTSGAYAPVDWTLPSEDIPGDLNGDGMVGSADLDIVRGNWGADVTAGDLLAGDASGDGTVGSADLDIVRANWGQSAPTSVPEPSVFVLLLAGLLLTRRRR